MDAGASAAVHYSKNKNMQRFPDAILRLLGACKGNREARLPSPNLGFTSQE